MNMEMRIRWRRLFMVASALVWLVGFFLTTAAYARLCRWLMMKAVFEYRLGSGPWKRIAARGVVAVRSKGVSNAVWMDAFAKQATSGLPREP